MPVEFKQIEGAEMHVTAATAQALKHREAQTFGGMLLVARAPSTASTAARMYFRRGLSGKVSIAFSDARRRLRTCPAFYVGDERTQGE